MTLRGRCHIRARYARRGALETGSAVQSTALAIEDGRINAIYVAHNPNKTAWLRARLTGR